MPYKKGHKKTGGRKKGVGNRSTEAVKNFLARFFELAEGEVDELWKELKAKEKMDAIAKLADFELARKARIENENKLPQSITINMIPASPERLAENNTIDITHQEIDEETDA